MSNHTEITTESQHVTALKDALDRNDRVRARNHAEALVRLRPDLARSHFNLGVILLQARDWEKAHTAFACALRIEPGHEKARLGLLAARKALRPAESQGSPKAGGPPAQVTPISIASPASAVPPGEARSPSRFPQPQTALPSAVRPPNVPPLPAPPLPPSPPVPRVECPASFGRAGKAKRGLVRRLAQLGIRVAIVAAAFIAGMYFEQWGGLDRAMPTVIGFARENFVGDDMTLDLERRFLGLVDSMRLRLRVLLDRNGDTAKYRDGMKTEPGSSEGEGPASAGASQGNPETTPGAALAEPAPGVESGDSRSVLRDGPVVENEIKGRSALENSSPRPVPPPGGEEVSTGSTAPVPEIGSTPESAGATDPDSPLPAAPAEERLESPAVAEAPAASDTRHPSNAALSGENTPPAPAEPDIWEPGGISSKSGRPLYSKTVIHPDPRREYAVVHLYRFDMTALRLEFIPGCDKSKRLPGRMDSRQRQQVAWMFNGGFQYRHGQFGAKLNDNLIHPPRPGIATLLLGPDNTCDIVEWPGPSGNPPQAPTYCQNEVPLIMDGSLSPNIEKMWGYTPREQDPIFTERSALGFTARNHLVFAAGKSVSANTLGQALLQAGVVKAMHLDMNHYNVHLVRAKRTAAGDLATENEDGMLSYYPRLYLDPTDRDFFILTMKPEEG